MGSHRHWFHFTAQTHLWTPQCPLIHGARRRTVFDHFFLVLYYLVYCCRLPIGACTFGTVSGYSGHFAKVHYFYSCCSGCSISCHQTSFRNWVQLIRLELSGRCCSLLHPCLQVGQAHWLWHFTGNIPGVLVLYLGWPSCGSFDHRILSQMESPHCFR